MIFKKKHAIPTEHEDTARQWLASAVPEGMNAEEREKSRVLLTEYMAMRPMRATRTEGGEAVSPLERIRALLPISRGRLSPLVAFMAFLVLMTSTTYAAEGALPGNPLYAMKLKVNEEVRAALAFSTEARADWSIRRAERRLEEASLLAMQGTLDEKTRRELAANIEKHVKTAKVQSSRLANAGMKNAIAVSETEAKLQASLDAHISVLGAIEAATTLGASRDEIASVLQGLKKYASAAPTLNGTVTLMAFDRGASTAQAGLVAPAEAATSFEAAEIRAIAKKHLEHAEKTMQRAVRASEPFDTESGIWAGADVRLEVAWGAYRSGETARDEEEYDAAARYFTTAMRAAIESEAIFSARLHLFNALKKNIERTPEGGDMEVSSSSAEANDTPDAMQRSSSDAGASAGASSSRATSTILLQENSDTAASMRVQPLSVPAQGDDGRSDTRNDEVKDALIRTLGGIVR